MLQEGVARVAFKQKKEVAHYRLSRNIHVDTHKYSSSSEMPLLHPQLH